MNRGRLDDLAAFMTVADTRSFTQAAAQLGISASALSHAMTRLEAGIGLRLLARTTRSVATTEAGERLLRTLRPALDDIGTELAALEGLREKPSGTLRITTFKHAATTVLLPALPGFLAAYPDVEVEITVDDALTDIVASRYDAGIRWGEKVAKDMIAVPVSPPIRSAVVASPDYFAAHPAPTTPQDLAAHRCINYRTATTGDTYAWQFEEDGRPFRLRVTGPLVLNDGDLILAAALAGQGIANLYEDLVAEHVAAGRLVRVLAEWCPPRPGFYLYYPSRRRTPALAALVAALRDPASSAPQPTVERNSRRLPSWSRK
jgi:DNA-binding transcriptional LysR family regulator